MSLPDHPHILEVCFIAHHLTTWTVLLTGSHLSDESSTFISVVSAAKRTTTAISIVTCNQPNGVSTYCVPATLSDTRVIVASITAEILAIGRE